MPEAHSPHRRPPRGLLRPADMFALPASHRRAPNAARRLPDRIAYRSTTFLLAAGALAALLLARRVPEPVLVLAGALGGWLLRS